MLKIRPRPTVSPSLPDTIPSIPRPIWFRHPGYDDQHNVLFTLIGLDSPEGGLHRETARLACAIVAANRWDGYLSTSANGPRIGDGVELLMEFNYYFIVPPPTPPTSQDTTADDPSAQYTGPLMPPKPYKYPIVPNFREWRFPHGDLPNLWNTLSTTSIDPARHGPTTVIARDLSCRMTEYVDGCQVAHLCPKVELEWFMSNQMFMYVFSDMMTSNGIDDPANTLLLRADLHQIFDNRSFVFIPKDDGVIATHVLGFSKELRTLYHNTPLCKLGVGREFLFARFAWAIFDRLRGFLGQGQERVVKLAFNNVTRVAKPDECSDLGKSSQSRAVGPKANSSPRKRSRFEDPNEDVEDERDWQARQGFDFATLVEEKLHSERDRSDPEGRWQKELQWLKDVQDQGSLDEADRPRYFGVIGRSVTPSDV